MKAQGNSETPEEWCGVNNKALEAAAGFGSASVIALPATKPTWVGRVKPSVGHRFTLLDRGADLDAVLPTEALGNRTTAKAQDIHHYTWLQCARRERSDISTSSGVFEPNVDVKKRGDGSTALNFAVNNKRCDKESTELLLESGADVDMLDPTGKSPLYHAVRDNREQTSLLWAGRYLRFMQSSVLSDAVVSGLEGRDRQLLEARIDQNERDNCGRIALDVAVSLHIQRLLSPDDPVYHN
ncbi:hypothetical protein J3459_022325 [Metarhizium acridum]|uniref:uncharacterized protein n=1 Tax=Metarhizium acridum TaxID=92637 RepID=UPI001C6AD6E1|nr:hypothetical protein J3459_022416 [Metarhizium acridum]KAG8404999.1 hypothetical protein J3459_022325 [Metarhizium acridum]KAG8410797.1 hypothetical protein J3458_016886 [Metarhizium acridum]